ncbi:unnamed protein product [Urochloa decumbens]|uniref:RRM domain-containing protein n=1 Tax=Urochloa decumbens TaxID=240449 RepID=A0ABC9C8D8_9POAL
MGSSTTEIPLDPPRPSTILADEPNPSGSGDPPPPTSNNAAGAAAAATDMFCTTCGKEGGHVDSDCPYQDLLARRRRWLPPAPTRASPRRCPVCRRNPNPGRRRWEDDSTVRVSNLPEATSDRDLYNLCAPFGIVNRVSLSPAAADTSPPPGPAGGRRLVGVVKFEQVQDGEKAISWLDGYFYGGIVIKAEWAVPFDGTHPPICASCLRRGETCVRVSNLSERAGERDLYNLCCRCGIIRRLRLEVDEQSVSPTRRQVGVVEFLERKDAEDAVWFLNGHVFDDLALRVEGPLKLLF